MQYVKSEQNSADALSRLSIPVKHAEKDSESVFVGTYLQCIREISMPFSCDDVKVETQNDIVLK